MVKEVYTIIFPDRYFCKGYVLSGRTRAEAIAILGKARDVTSKSISVILCEIELTEEANLIVVKFSSKEWQKFWEASLQAV